MKLILKLITTTILFTISSSALSASMMDEFIDPEDGMFDVSH